MPSNEPTSLDRAAMERAIAQGGSVLYKGNVIRSVSELPSAAELALTQDERTKARAGLQSQMDSLKTQMESLDRADEEASRSRSSQTGPQAHAGESGEGLQAAHAGESAGKQSKR